MSDKDKQLEAQKQDLIDSAEIAFGKEYFERIEKLSEDLLLMDEEKDAGFTLTVNYQGAFYAGQE